VEIYIEKLKGLFKQWSGKQPDKVTAIPPSAHGTRLMKKMKLFSIFQSISLKKASTFLNYTELIPLRKLT